MYPLKKKRQISVYKPFSEEVRKRTGLSKVESEVIVEIVMDKMTQMISEGEDITIPGCMSVVARPLTNLQIPLDKMFKGKGTYKFQETFRYRVNLPKDMRKLINKNLRENPKVQKRLEYLKYRTRKTGKCHNANRV
jgi:hypothetical protein